MAFMLKQFFVASAVLVATASASEDVAGKEIEVAGFTLKCTPAVVAILGGTACVCCSAISIAIYSCGDHYSEAHQQREEMIARHEQEMKDAKDAKADKETKEQLKKDHDKQREMFHDGLEVLKAGAPVLTAFFTSPPVTINESHYSESYYTNNSYSESNTFVEETNVNEEVNEVNQVNFF